MRALDRYDQNIRWEPVAHGFAEPPPDGALLALNVAWDDFVLLSIIRRGQDNLSAGELMRASALGPQFGYIPQLFEAELIHRFADPLFYLPILIFTLVLGWHFRAVRKSRFTWIPMLFALPLVFNGIIQMGRAFLLNMSVWTVFSFGFTFAIFAFSLSLVLLLFLSLIVLASQHG